MDFHKTQLSLTYGGDLTIKPTPFRPSPEGLGTTKTARPFDRIDLGWAALKYPEIMVIYPLK